MPFFSELVGRPVVDSANRPVGKLADMVVSSDARYPIVTAVTITPRHHKTPVYVPWEAVVSLEQPVVLRHALDELTPYQPHDG